MQNKISQCLKYLIEANKLDDSDKALGLSLASRDRLTDKQMVEAAVMLQKYRDQLNGFNLPTLVQVRRFVVSNDSAETRYVTSDRFNPE